MQSTPNVNFEHIANKKNINKSIEVERSIRQLGLLNSVGHSLCIVFSCDTRGRFNNGPKPVFRLGAMGICVYRLLSQIPIHILLTRSFSVDISIIK